MKYSVYVAQYFDTYFEWERLFGMAEESFLKNHMVVGKLIMLI